MIQWRAACFRPAPVNLLTYEYTVPRNVVDCRSIGRRGWFCRGGFDLRAHLEFAATSRNAAVAGGHQVRHLLPLGAAECVARGGVRGVGLSGINSRSTFVPNVSSTGCLSMRTWNLPGYPGAFLGAPSRESEPKGGRCRHWERQRGRLRHGRGPRARGEQIGRPHLFNRRLVGFSPAVVLETLGFDGKKLSGGSPEGAQARAGLERECGGAAADELATGYVVAQGSRG